MRWLGVKPSVKGGECLGPCFINNCRAHDYDYWAWNWTSPSPSSCTKAQRVLRPGHLDSLGYKRRAGQLETASTN